MGKEKDSWKYHLLLLPMFACFPVFILIELIGLSISLLLIVFGFYVSYVLLLCGLMHYEFIRSDSNKVIKEK